MELSQIGSLRDSQKCRNAEVQILTDFKTFVDSQTCVYSYLLIRVDSVLSVYTLLHQVYCACVNLDYVFMVQVNS